MWLKQMRQVWRKTVWGVLAFTLLLCPVPGSSLQASPLLSIPTLVAEVPAVVDASATNPEAETELTTQAPSTSSTILPTSPTILPTSPTILPTSPTILPTSPTILPTSPTILPTLSPEFFDSLQQQSKPNTNPQSQG